MNLWRAYLRRRCVQNWSIGEVLSITGAFLILALVIGVTVWGILAEYNARENRHDTELPKEFVGTTGRGSSVYRICIDGAWYYTVERDGWPIVLTPATLDGKTLVPCAEQLEKRSVPAEEYGK